ncbi:hypothetical protein DFJ73DRAFT_964574, partial [Zopfochytrium polystomum]
MIDHRLPPPPPSQSSPPPPRSSPPSSSSSSSSSSSQQQHQQQLSVVLHARSHQQQPQHGDHHHGPAAGAAPPAQPDGQQQPLFHLQPPATFPFPYGTPWKIQSDFMTALYSCIESKSLGFFESPTGTGKSLSIICGALKWLADHNARPYEARLAALVNEKLIAAGLEPQHSAPSSSSSSAQATTTRDRPAPPPPPPPKRDQDPDWVTAHQRAAIARAAKAELDAADARRARAEDRLRALRGSSTPAATFAGRKRAAGEPRVPAAAAAAGAGKRARAAAGGADDGREDPDGDEVAGDGDDRFLVDCESDGDAGEARGTGRRRWLSIGYDHDDDDESENGALRPGLDDGSDDDILQETKIFYTSRTHSQLSQFVNELKKTEYSTRTKLVSLGSRKNLCIHKDVSKLKNVTHMNDRCLDMQKGKAAPCPHLPKDKAVLASFAEQINAEIYDIEELASLGKSEGVCPYYGARAAVPASQVVTMPYNMMLQASTREALGIKVDGNVIIFDEAHNVVDTISAIHSVTLDQQQISRAEAELFSYFEKYRKQLRGKNVVYIKQIALVLARLREGLEARANVGSAKNPFTSSTDLIHDTQLDQVNLFKIVAFLEQSRLAQKLHGFTEQSLKKRAAAEAKTRKPAAGGGGGRGRGPPALELDPAAASDGGPTPAASSNVPALQAVELFLKALVSPDKDGRVGVVEQDKPSSPLTPPPPPVPANSITRAADAPPPPPPAARCYRFLHLNPSTTFAPLLAAARSVVLAGGTLSPVDALLQDLLPAAPPTTPAPAPAPPVVTFRCGHVVPRESVLPVAVGRGPRGGVLDFRWEARGGGAVIAELGETFARLVAAVPAGVVAFFGSYGYMNEVMAAWRATGVVGRLEAVKKVFVEPTLATEVEACLSAYAAAVGDGVAGRAGGQTGAILFSVVGGKMSEGINFSDDLARAVFMVGLPFANRNSPELVEKMRYLDAKARDAAAAAGAGRDGAAPSHRQSPFILRSDDYYTALCARALNQAVGRAIRHRGDHAAIFLLDARFCERGVGGVGGGGGGGGGIRRELAGWIRDAGVREYPCARKGGEKDAAAGFEVVVDWTREFFRSVQGKR